MMSVNEDKPAVQAPGVPAARQWSAAIVVAAGVAVLLGFALAGMLAPWPALGGLIIILGAGWLSQRLATSRPHAGVSSAPQVLSGERTPLDAVIAALPDPAIILDHDTRVVAFNDQARQIAPALRRDDPVSLALRVPEVVDAIRHAAATGESVRVEFSERVPVDRCSEAFVTPMTAVGRDGYSLLLVSFHDLTPIRRVEEMRADFVANASHELRTPLAALSGFIETLRGPARDDKAARERFLEIMEAQARRMARLIDDLLSLSRIELNAHLRPEKPVDLVSIVRQVVDALQTLAADRGVEIKVTQPPAPLVVPGDRDELIRVFENLIENALKYGGSGKRVEITLSEANTADGGREALVAVRDYGPGIAAEHLPRLTERFYRVDVAGSRAQGGTGLGLALVKHILNRHRGRLAIESRIGQGATFTVRLPLGKA
jgi:two-component system phosphate regulon sensor histidine kinase PhoR